MNIPIKIISEDSVIPKQANQSDAGYDLFSVEDVTLEPLERCLTEWIMLRKLIKS